MRGGARAGAGRPKGTLKENPNPRTHRQLRAYDDEWAVIKEFMKIVREVGAQNAADLLKKFNSE